MSEDEIKKIVHQYIKENLTIYDRFDYEKEYLLPYRSLFFEERILDIYLGEDMIASIPFTKIQ